MSFKESNGLVLDENTGIVGNILGVDYINQVVSLESLDGKPLFARIDETTFLKYIGEVGGQPVFNHDVFVTVDSRLFEVELVDDSTVLLYALNNQLERIGIVESYLAEDIDCISSYLNLIGSKYELEPEPEDELEFDDDDMDFNIRIVRDFSDGEATYFYACNNKEEEEIDLIKVVFVGAQLLEEDEYERITISYDEYLDALDYEELKEVSASNLMNYITGMTYGTTRTSYFDIQEDEDFDIDNDDW